jgi:hypothetical protein
MVLFSWYCTVNNKKGGQRREGKKQEKRGGRKGGEKEGRRGRLLLSIIVQLHTKLPSFVEVRCHPYSAGIRRTTVSLMV